ncbi:MAG: lipoate--protein ligase family protein [Gemmatimonadaceae bacterium]
MSSSRRWRFLVTPPLSGAENMAMDEALKERARVSGEWTMRVYSWAAPTVSLGRNQRAKGQYDLGKIAALGATVVRRPTGGRAILHDREITYSVTAPADDAGELYVSYNGINRLLQQALRLVGVNAELAAPVRVAAPPGMSPCFNEPSAGELVFQGRKLAGSAQWRSEGSMLQHGSILVGDDQSILSTLTVAEGPPIPVPATLSDALGRAPTVEELAIALRSAIESEEGYAPPLLEIDDEIRARTESLVVRYLDDEWTWRR